MAFSHAREETMRAAGPNGVFGHTPWPQARAPSQIEPDGRLAVQSPAARKALLENGIQSADVAAIKVSFGPFCLLPTQFLLLEGNKPVSIGSRALEILIALLDRRGELVSNHELMARVWPNLFVEPANLTVHISALRRALRDGQNGNRFIVNIPGRGYCFVAPVELSEQHKQAAEKLDR
jgi:DNA-binding winged helix-turn-helix (wHTH) protein